MSTYHGSLPNAGNDEHRYKGQVASNVDVGNSTSLESYVSTENDTILTVLQNVWNSVKSGTDAISEKLDNGEILMALTTEESNKLNAALDLMTETALLNRQCLSIFQAGGVANADLASTLAEAKAYAQDISHVNTGVLATANGGTGRSDGMVEDVYISGSGNSVVTAKGTGQIGNPVTKNGENVNADTIITSGIYYINNGNVSNNYPVNGLYGILNVYADSTGCITQNAVTRNGLSYFQRRRDSNSVWSGWVPISFSTPNNVNIYISKDGNDNNIGIVSTSPVLTFARAVEIARGITTTGTITFCFGAGDWGTVDIYGNTLSASFIKVGSIDPSNPAVFNLLRLQQGSFYITSLSATYILLSNSYAETTDNISGNGTVNISIGRLGVTSDSYLYIAHNIIFKNFNITGNYNLINLYFNSWFRLSGSITFDQNLPSNAVVFIETHSNATIRIDGSASFTGDFGGKKYSFNLGHTEAITTNPSNYPGTTAGTGNYYLNGIPQQGVVLTTGDQEVGGDKKYNGQQYIAKGGQSLLLSDATSNTCGTLPSGTLGTSVSYIDTSGSKTEYGALVFNVYANGFTRTTIRAIENIAGSSRKSHGIIVEAPLPTDTSNSPAARPMSDNTMKLGLANFRFSEVFAGTATINTSDERIKSNISAIPDAALDVWGEVNWVQYQFNDAIAKKGANARLHTGTVAQRIKSIFEAKGLDATRYGLLCHDSWDASDETIIDKKAVTETVKVVDKAAVYGTRTVVISPAYTDEEGVEHPAETMEEQYEVSPEVSHEEERVIEPEVSHVEHHPAGDLYSLRYEECFAFEAAYQRRKVAQLEARIAALEAKLA